MARNTKPDYKSVKCDFAGSHGYGSTEKQGHTA